MTDAIVGLDYRRRPKGAMRITELSLFDDAYSDHPDVATAPG
jgi:hypothetical protein